MNTFKKKIYNICRNYLKRKFTGNLGKVVEEEDKLVCYVKKKKLKKYKTKYIICYGITEKNQKLASSFKLNKPICYIIDGIKSEKTAVCISGHKGCEVIVRNCKFNLGLDITVSGKCTLENTFISSFHLLSIGAKEMIIKNMNINQGMKLAGTSLHIKIGADKNLTIIDSNIGEKIKSVNVDIISEKKLDVINSKIIGNNINVRSPIIEFDDSSSFIALRYANIKIDDFKKLNVESPFTIFNGKHISKYDKKIQLEKVDNPLKNERLKFLDVLKQISNNCTQINEQRTEDYKDTLNNQSVSKVLNKRIKKIINP